MAFEYRFNVIRFYSKLNRFVLSPRKKPNHFVLKIRPGGFADYINPRRVLNNNFSEYVDPMACTYAKRREFYGLYDS